MKSKKQCHPYHGSSIEANLRQIHHLIEMMDDKKTHKTNDILAHSFVLKQSITKGDIIYERFQCVCGQKMNRKYILTCGQTAQILCFFPVAKKRSEATIVYDGENNNKGG